MKLLWAIVVYLIIGAVLGWAILLTVKGNPWVFLTALLVYVVAFTRLGCLKSH